MYVYIQSEPGLWTVGFYKPNGEFEPETDQPTLVGAAKRVAWLNGQSRVPVAIHYDVILSRTGPDEWRVEGIDYDNDGQIYVALFTGGDAYKRAAEYAEFKNRVRTTWSLPR